MKKIYALLILLLTFSYVTSQTVLVTVDRANVTGPTLTGNAASVSSTGFTRGSGVSSSNGTDFSSKGWNATTLVDAAIANEYSQWSVSADTNFNIDLTSLDIRLSRNNNGPQDWQLLYSLDGFATPGIAIGTAQTATTTETNYNFSGLVINSGDAGTITFRLFAWNANNNGGSLAINGEPVWSGFGITDPGSRLSGQVNSIPLFSAESNIISTSFDPTDNIDYTLFNTPAVLTTTNAIKIGEFSIQDGGDDQIDADILPTVLTDITFAVNGNTNIAALAIFDGAINISESTTVNPTTTFNGINSGLGITTPDGGTKIFEVYATFNTAVTDNDQLQLAITSASANGITGSSFAAIDAGGAQTPIVIDDNRIEVTATALSFDVQPSDVNIFIVMEPAPTILAVDGNANLDLDYTGTVIISSTGTSFDPLATLSVSANAGTATFDNIIFNSTGSNESLLAVSLDGLSFTISNTFNILDLILTIANQDFDGSTPEWTYTTDIAFFDNGWGTDGYYGIINSNIASPLDYTSFSGNILGTNDLNDEGNGTASFATVTFSTVDISAYTNVALSFDWETDGYGNNDEAQYEVFFDGVGQGVVDLTSIGIEGTESVVIPDNVDSISLQVLIKSNGDLTFCGFDNFLLNSTFDGLIYHSNAWIPNAPTNGTGSLNALVLDGTYTINSDVAINNIIVNDNAVLIIEKGKSLTVNGELICDENITLESDSTEYSSLIVEGTVTGNVTYQRHVNTNAAGNDLISAPVTGETFGVFASNNNNLFSNPANPTEKLFGIFSKVTGTYLTYDTNVPAEASITLDAGIGYRAASTDNLNFSFSGLVNTNTINVPIVVAGPNQEEWNLVGNPYPSYIKLSNWLALNSSQLAIQSVGIWGYDGFAPDGWTIWNQAYSDLHPDAVITPGQGFLVACIDGGGTISFTPTMRSIGTTDDFILLKSSRIFNGNISHLELKIASTNLTHKTDFYFSDNGSLGLDPGYDATAFGGFSPSFSIYSHLIEDNEGKDISVQTISNNDVLNNAIIPLGINSIQGQQVSISIENSTLDENIDVYLKDNLTNTFTLLNTGDYTFTPNSDLNGIGRFFLHFDSERLSAEENVFNELLVYSSASAKKLYIKGLLLDSTTLKLYDIQGRVILSKTLNGNNSDYEVDLSEINTGVYIVHLKNDTQIKSQKIIIK